MLRHYIPEVKDVIEVGGALLQGGGAGANLVRDLNTGGSSLPFR